jgi:hypothetical protein
MLTLLQQSHVAKAKRKTTTTDSASASAIGTLFYFSRHRLWFVMLIFLPLFALIFGYYQLGLVQLTIATSATAATKTNRPKEKNATATTRTFSSSSPTAATLSSSSASSASSSWDELSLQFLPEARQRQARHAEWKLRQQQQPPATNSSSTRTTADYSSYNSISNCRPLQPTTVWTKTRTVLVTPDTNWTLLYKDQSLIPVYSNLSDFMLGEADLFDPNSTMTKNRTTEALCELYDEPGRSDTAHFPHAMEVLYRCWSYWQSFPDQHAVLVYPHNHVVGLYAASVVLSNMTDLPTADSAQRLTPKVKTTTTSNFLQGFVQALILQLNVTLRERPPPAAASANANATTLTLLPPPEPHPRAVRIQHTPNFLDGYALASPLHAQALVNGILGPPLPIENIYNNGTRDQPSPSCPCPNDNFTDDDEDDDDMLVLPRIAILNRQEKHKRSLRNVQELANALEDAMMELSSAAASATTATANTTTAHQHHHHVPQQPQQQHPSSSRWTVPIVYFENATFLQQLQFFAHHDIVITGHGAQLTGLTFMRQPPPPPPAAASAADDASQSQYQQTTIHGSTTAAAASAAAAAATCRASIVEIFPFGYCMPSFFGSLAVASGHDHYHVSVDSVKSEAEEQHGCVLNIKRRVQKRQVNLCPNWQHVVPGIMQIVQDWKDNHCSSRRGRDRPRAKVCSCPGNHR